MQMFNNQNLLLVLQHATDIPTVSDDEISLFFKQFNPIMRWSLTYFNKIFITFSRDVYKIEPQPPAILKITVCKHEIFSSFIAFSYRLS